MFCFQCQETAGNEACKVRGVCGKPEDVAHLQDLTVWALKGLSLWGVKAREWGISHSEADRLVAQALFTTLANTNLDADRFVAQVDQILQWRDQLQAEFRAAYRQAHGQEFAEPLPEMATWTPEPTGNREEYVRKGGTVGILADPDLHEDVRSLRELLIYGLKGLAAYTDHAYVLEYQNDSLLAFLQEGLAATADDTVTGEALVDLALKCGEMGVQAMALLDEANTQTYGHPEITQVDLGVQDGPAILISGHDLRDLAELLEQTAGTGVKVYTHGEMLPAHAYPAFKKHPHLVGHYGGAWYLQQEEFEKFRGAILMTTNCLTPLRDTYTDRLFTTGAVGWPGQPHIPDRSNGGSKNFSAVIAKAQQLGSPEPLEDGTLTIGFAHNTVLSVADKVVDAVNSGAIKRFVVMAGCDGRHRARQYFTEMAQSLPADVMILTAGCAKYRYNKLDLGDIGGIPRVLDAGQCNDSYSLVVVAQKLAEVFGLDDINDLPVSYDIAWYEQKAVLVLLALLHLGVKNIHLGPTLPAFLSPNVAQVLVENFNIQPITTVEQDLPLLLAGQ